MWYVYRTYTSEDGFHNIISRGHLYATLRGYNGRIYRGRIAVKRYIPASKLAYGR